MGEHELRARLQQLAQEREAKRQLIVSLGPEATSANRMGTATCANFCPDFELVERTLHGDVTAPFESVDSPRSVIKKYHRPAAGNDQPLPEDIRPVRPVLVDCVDYMMSEVLAGFPTTPLLEKQKFLRDRLRSVRQDLTYQGCRDLDAVAINECIARFHIYVGWVFQGGRAASADFDAFQNVEQLRKVLQTLHELYDLHPNKCPGRDEFTSYRRLAHLDDPKESFDSNTAASLGPLERIAIDVAFCFHSGNPALLKRVSKSTPFLFQCLLESQWQRAMDSKAQDIVATAFADGERDRLPEQWALRFALSPMDNLQDLSMLLRGRIDDDYFRERRIRLQWLSETSQHVFNATIPSSIHTLVAKVFDEAMAMAARQRDLHEQQRRLHMVNVARAWGEEFWEHERASMVIRLTERIMQECLQSLERARLEHVVTLIYDSLLSVCVPFFTQRIVAETLAEQKATLRLSAHTWQLWRHTLERRRFYNPEAFVAPPPPPPEPTVEIPVAYLQLQAQLDALKAEVAREEAWNARMAEQLEML